MALPAASYGDFARAPHLDADTSFQESYREGVARLLLEDHHRFLREKLEALGIIPPCRGRSAKSPMHQPATFYRRFVADLSPIPQFGQRWQIECDFSMLKRLLDDKVRSRLSAAIDHEVMLRILTLNVMIVSLPIGIF